MPRSIYILIVLSSFLLFFYSCNSPSAWDPFKVRGATISETHILSPFTILDVYDKIDVYYKQDTTSSSYSIQIVTGKNLLPNISTEISGGVLKIKNKNEFNFLRGAHNGVTVYVTTPFIGKIIQDGVGTIYCSNTITHTSTHTQDTLSYQIKNSGDMHLNVNVQSMKGSIYGVGDIYLNGICPHHEVYASGECFINALNLVTGYSFVDYNSTGQAHVYVTGQLDAVINSTGTIYYSGGVTVINKSGTGTGKLIPN